MSESIETMQDYDELFYTIDDDGTVTEKPRPETRPFSDVERVVNKHASNPAKRHVIYMFLEMYLLGLQWDWFEYRKTWLKELEDIESNPPERARDQDGQFLSDDPDTDINEAYVNGYTPEMHEAVYNAHMAKEMTRPPVQTVEDASASMKIKDVPIDEFIFRNQRHMSVSGIVVEVDGMLFDGDEASQRRMLSAIRAGEDRGLTETLWRMSDDSEQVITLDQLKVAHSKAIIAQGSMWMKGDQQQ